ncbi:ABC transporter ATP-binding protein [Oceanicella actignis]|uniref:Capsular polysaccharide transport system ATP-binding protein n=1 Tax=Oceanicella actignis TaxID=1189325 RepID=A0A1M7TU48_9RHOB|nr:ABC transporter ATP-binding protein [Oceanicella actignis]TYO90513.1 capsular polysaccharide transport system ATP-binding protein [Oceanicella actignis]SES78248.1 capsular polysaccharide transport system ATP-binding protein [Oceanicella actignis]SHN74264.1 capsular polysaccharide transport system ATP-binding protein [Oceanicella actignis]
MIRLENVSKTFRLPGGLRKTVVRDLTMTIPRGRSLALLGRNGAGKSSLLRLIAGTLRPDSGRVIHGCRVSWPLGFSGSFHRAMSGIQNVRFVARIYGVDADELIAFVREFSELGDYLHQPVAVYSAGMKARLAFGVSMGIRFDVYLVDETIAVGDADFKRKCRAVFEDRLSASDVIMVSHAPGPLRSYCDCGLVLENGRLEYYDDVEDAIARHVANLSAGHAGAALREAHEELS